MTKQEILEYFKDINHAYNESTRLDDLSHMLDELIQSNSDKEAYRKGYKDGQEALAFHLELCEEEQEPCEDCISRAKLKEYISKDESTDFFKGWNRAIDAIYTTAPSIQPTAKENLVVGDCISRKEVCDYIAEFVNHEYATDREHEMVEHIISGIQHLPSIQPKPKTDWIPVSERLPKAYQECLFTVIASHWANEPVTYRVIQKAYGGEQNFIAWMPLPKPYKGESEYKE